MVAYADTPGALHGLAALSLQAHLDKLIAEGEVRRSGDRFAPGAAA